VADQEQKQKRVNVIEHPLALSALTALRDKSTPPERFRMMSNLLLMLLTIEGMRDLPVRDRVINATDGASAGRVLGKPVLFISVNRSGLAPVHSIVDQIPNLLMGSISLERSGEKGALEPRLHFSAAPAMDNARVILFQPVVATGNSAAVALDLLRRGGASDMMLITYMVSFEGLNRVHDRFPEVPIWTGAIDSEWNSARGPMRGFGKFSERLFG
jgi:uracil phosphoribosyltransferase